ncbi:DUF2254 domain-containing protein [Streptomyces sp. NPDC006879]|uniref:DUF2254 domain-containing protein n=1 Tax=Streptomyces sp. NPDC006879 TaxID=3364767 RepID=UPI0036BB049E
MAKSTVKSVDRRARGPFPRLRKQLRNSFLFIPFTGLACGWFLATAVVQLDTFIHELDTRWENVNLQGVWFLRTAQDLGASAKTAVGTMSAAMLTFIGVVFSITLVALQMAAGQFSPRVLRIYVESGVTKLTLAVFLCTFLYTLRIQKEYTASERPADAVIPYTGASLAMGFVVLSLVLFVVYVHATIRLMRVTYVMDRVCEESLGLIRRVVVPTESPGGHGDAEAVAADSEGRPSFVVAHGWRPGVLQAVDAGRLVRLARRQSVVLHLVPKVGDFLCPGAPLYRVIGANAPRPSAVQSALDIGVERTTEQDLAFGLRQLADIAARALSPGVNDPTTAVQALDRIQVLLTALAAQPLGRIHHRDAEGVIRLVESLPTWPELLDLALTEARHYGVESAQVTRRIAACLDDLERLVPQDRRPPLRLHRELLEEEVRARSSSTQQGDFALRPDRQGIG